MVAKTKMNIQLVLLTVSIGLALGAPQTTSTTAAPTTTTLSPEQLQLNADCKAECGTAAMCSFSGDSCASYVQCVKTETSGYDGKRRPCAHGAYFDRNSGVCVNYKTAKCATNYCQGKPDGHSYTLKDGPDRCRMYWECQAGEPEPKCCKEGTTFDEYSKACVTSGPSNPCNAECTIKQDQCATGSGYEAFPDNNCGSYWNCTGGHHDCCPATMEFNPDTSECIDSGRCQNCPSEYGPGVCATDKRMAVKGPYCGTYISCENGKTSKVCCPKDKRFDEYSDQCVSLEKNSKCSTSCPKDLGFNYKECPLKAVVNEPSSYMSGKDKMNCPVGVTFNPVSCGCHNRAATTIDNSCRIAVDLIGVNSQSEIINNGSESMLFLQQNDVTTGPNNGMVFKQYSKIPMPYFQQPMANFYMKVSYISSGANSKQFLSSCDSQPSISLSQTGNTMTLTVRTDENPKGVTLSVTIPSGYQRNTVTCVLYSNTAYLMVKGDQQNTVPANQYASIGVNGAVLSSEHPPTVGGCKTLGNGFTGEMLQFKMGNCLTQKLINEFNESISPA